MKAQRLGWLAACLFAASAHAQDSDAPVPIESIPVAPGLTMLIGKGGNLAVSTGASGPVVVDDQYAEQIPGIGRAVKALQDAPIRFVINTHYHDDHTGGNAALGGGGAVIVAHDNVRVRLSTEQFSKLLDRKTPPKPASAWPVVTFAEGVVLHLNDETITIEHVANAHTDGDAIVWFSKANAVHCGDTFFNGIYPFVDVESGGSFAGMIAAADRVLGAVQPGTKIIPGHGPLATPADLKRFRDMLATVKQRVEAAIADGKTMEAFTAEKPLADLDAEWGDGFLKAEQILTLAWLDLAAKR
jgi:glyoxylase-like metal-dependent hydrolase (beta-lactamase superfamily II)